MTYRDACTIEVQTSFRGGVGGRSRITFKTVDFLVWVNSHWTAKFYHRGKPVYYETQETNKRMAHEKAKKYEVELKG